MENNINALFINKYLIFLTYLLIPFIYAMEQYGCDMQKTIILFLVFLCIFNSFLMVLLTKKFCFHPHFLKTNIILLIMLLYYFVAAFFSWDFYATLTNFIIMTLTIIFYFIMHNTLLDDYQFSDLSAIIGVINFQVCLFIIISIVLMISGPVYLFGMYIEPFMADRLGKSMSSLFVNANTFAMLLSIGIYANLLLISINNCRNINKYMLFIVVYFICLLFTQSRSGIFSVLIVLLVFLLANLKEFNLIRILKNLLLVAFILVFIGTISYFIYIELSKMFELNIVFLQKFLSEDPLRGREEKYQVAIQLIKQNPLFGVGILSKINNLDPVLYSAFRTHNGYLTLALIGGIPLLGLYIFFILLTTIRAIKTINMWREQPEIGVLKTLMIILLGILIHQLFETTAIFGSVLSFYAMFMWLIFTYIYIIINRFRNA